jgi:hypothetical protein
VGRKGVEKEAGRRGRVGRNEKEVETRKQEGREYGN